RYTLDMKKVIDADLTIEDGAIKVIYGFNKGLYFKMLIAFCDQNDINIKIPFSDLEEHQKKAILAGTVVEVTFFLKKHKLS
ncbi:hypothetical protein ACOL3J_11475, partial [Aliarcobacter butzleri]